jgi:peptidoglycan/xylan/chitin deacetylase (PgdA/CDA1 family)
MRVASLTLISSAAAVFSAYSAPVVSLFPQGRLLFPAICQTGAEGAVSLTFDDGPDRGLDAFLGRLEEYGAQATFFVVGEQVERGPGRLQEIVSCGHEVAVHCYRHRNHLRLTPGQVMEDMRRARGIIEEKAERTTRLFRPPYGVFNLASWLEASRQGWERVLWTRWGRDWKAGASPESIVSRIGRPEAGDILLLHDSDRYAAPDSWRNTLGALPILLERISSLDLRVRPIGELLDTGSVRCPHP